jgi:hypothetical protein
VSSASTIGIASRYSKGVSRAYEEIVEFIAGGTRPSDIAAFQPSEEAKERVADLIAREKSTGLSPDEAGELEHYLQLEHLMRLAKARARAHLARG